MPSKDRRALSARYTVKPKADSDLDDYADYLAREANIEVGLRFLAAAHETFGLLCYSSQYRMVVPPEATGAEAVARVSRRGV
ncbi:MAG: hypothetical protein ACR2I2_09510 [Bryobacteraceae bacterium]